MCIFIYIYLEHVELTPRALHLMTQLFHSLGISTGQFHELTSNSWLQAIIYGFARSDPYIP